MRKTKKEKESCTDGPRGGKKIYSRSEAPNIIFGLSGVHMPTFRVNPSGMAKCSSPGRKQSSERSDEDVGAQAEIPHRRRVQPAGVAEELDGDIIGDGEGGDGLEGPEHGGHS